MPALSQNAAHAKRGLMGMICYRCSADLDQNHQRCFLPAHPARRSGCRVHTGWRSAAAISDNRKRSVTEEQSQTLLSWRSNISYPRPLHRVVKVCPHGSQTQPAGVDGPRLKGRRTFRTISEATAAAAPLYRWRGGIYANTPTLTTQWLSLPLMWPLTSPTMS